MEQKINAFIRENREDILRDVGTLIEIPSISADEQEGAPFGDACRRCLDKALGICERMGMPVKNYDYYAGSASVGNGEKEIMIMAHLDVVPAGNGWSTDPFHMVEKDGFIYGRGVADDKGPLILSLYALKFLQESGIPLRYTYRLMMGCSEETGTEDVRKVKEMERLPAFMFTPDSSFPMSNGEKGIMCAEMRFSLDGAHIVGLYGGQASNVVADRCTVLLKGVSGKSLEDLDASRFDVQRTSEGLEVTAKGKSAHASEPEGSENAILILLEMLSRLSALTEIERKTCERAAATLGDCHGEGLGIACEDEVSGKLTHISGLARLEGKDLVLSYNIRYPVTAKGTDLTRRLSQHAREHGYTGKVISDSAPSYHSADSPEIQALLLAYREVTGQDGVPFISGGGTYARHFPNAVAYGPGFPDMKNPAGEGKGKEHMADECNDIQLMMKALKIYIYALLKLNEL